MDLFCYITVFPCVCVFCSMCYTMVVTIGGCDGGGRRILILFWRGGGGGVVFLYFWVWGLYFLPTRVSVNFGLFFYFT